MITIRRCKQFDQQSLNVNECSDFDLSSIGRYVGNRPIKLRKSTWKDRNIDIARKKEKEKKKLGLR